MRVVIPVEPVGKQRPRTVRTKEGRVVTFTPPRTVWTENLIRHRVMELGEYFERDVPLRVELTFYRQRPKSVPKKVRLPVSRPDWDNYAKLVMDALEKYAYHNDSQITTAIVQKRFGEPPRIEICLEEDEKQEWLV